MRDKDEIDDAPPRKTLKTDDGRALSVPSTSTRIKILFVDHTLPTVAAAEGVLREVLFGDRERLLRETSHRVGGLSSFRKHFLESLSAPLILDRSALLDCETSLWEYWDPCFASFVPLTCHEQLSTSTELSSKGALHIRLVTPRSHASATGRAVPQATPSPVKDLIPQRESTFLGTCAMIRLPTHHPHQNVNRSVPAVEPHPAGGSSSHRPHVRILLVRHGESEANVNPSIYKSVPDHAISLTEEGCRMGIEAGRYIKQYFEENHLSKANLGHHVRLLVSPYERTRQTAQNILKALNDKSSATFERWVDSVKELPYLAEQDFGLSEGEGIAAKAKCSEELDRINLQRKHRGKFWSRFPHGESPFDVAVRMSGVLSEIVGGCTTSTASRGRIQTFIVVSHGITIRAFIAAWCGKSPEWLSDSVNPPNCSIQLVDDTEYAGYVFGGFEHGKAVEAASIAIQDDPRQNVWNQYL